MDIYVGNLPYSAGDEELKSEFTRYGSVNSARVVMDRDSGRSKGFGFVEMPDHGEAQSAIDAMDGSMMDGRALKVNEARPREPRRDSGSRDSGGRNSGNRNSGNRW